MTTLAPHPISPRLVVEAVLADMGNRDPEPDSALAQRIIDALAAAGVEVIAPQDLEWGTCPGSGVFAEDESPGPHYVSLSLCSGCLEYDPE